MAFEMKPLSCNPAKLKGLSEKLIVSHYENNYGGETVELHHRAVGRARFCQRAGLRNQRFKREELIASNSMILHELCFDGLGDEGEPDKDLLSTLGSRFRQRGEMAGCSPRWAKRWVATRAG